MKKVRIIKKVPFLHKDWIVERYRQVYTNNNAEVFELTYFEGTTTYVGWVLEGTKKVMHEFSADELFFEERVRTYHYAIYLGMWGTLKITELYLNLDDLKEVFTNQETVIEYLSKDIPY